MKFKSPVADSLKQPKGLIEGTQKWGKEFIIRMFYLFQDSSIKDTFFLLMKYDSELVQEFLSFWIRTCRISSSRKSNINDNMILDEWRWGFLL